MIPEYLSELEHCTLCEWRCGVNRLEGDRGVCGIGTPVVAEIMLHPAPPSSCTIFLAGCNFRCLNCQNWEIAFYPESGARVTGFIEPMHVAEEALAALSSWRARLIGADRLFFSGGSPEPSLPYVEEIVKEARRRSGAKVNFDTNGFMNEESLERILEISDSITYDIKAYHDEIHRALTGAPVAPVLRNAIAIAEQAPEKLLEFRLLVIPGITTQEVAPVAHFIAGIDEELPLDLLAFRPNFVLEDHPYTTQWMMEAAVREAREAGLANVLVNGYPGFAGERPGEMPSGGMEGGAAVAQRRAADAGCISAPRNCKGCLQQQACPIRGYRARRSI